MLRFDAANDLFKNDRIRELSATQGGMRFLKIRSMSRTEQLKYFISKHSIAVSNTKSKDWLRLVYDSEISTASIDESILDCIKQSAKRDEIMKNSWSMNFIKYSHSNGAVYTRII